MDTLTAEKIDRQSGRGVSSGSFAAPDKLRSEFLSGLCPSRPHLQPQECLSAPLHFVPPEAETSLLTIFRTLQLLRDPTRPGSFGETQEAAAGRDHPTRLLPPGFFTRGLREFPLIRLDATGGLFDTVDLEFQREPQRYAIGVFAAAERALCGVSAIPYSSALA